MRRTSCTQIPGGRRPIDEDWERNVKRFWAEEVKVTDSTKWKMKIQNYSY